MSTAVAGFKIQSVSPMLPVADLDATIAFYCEVLLFSVLRRDPNYALVQRDDAIIHFMTAADDSVLAAVRGHTEIYLVVDGIEEYWEHVRQFRDKYRMRDLFERPYGMTEFHVSDPNSCLVFVGQRTATK